MPGSRETVWLPTLMEILSSVDCSFDSFLSSTPHLRELIEYIEVGTNWNLLGVLLGLAKKDLDGIEQQPGNCAQKAMKMFDLWLSTTPTASRKEILEALEKRPLSQNTVAEKYANHLKDLCKPVINLQVVNMHIILCCRFCFYSSNSYSFVTCLSCTSVSTVIQ